MTDPIPLPATPVLETARLILRPIEARDVPAVQRLFPQWEVVRWLHAGIPWPYPDDGAATNMVGCLAELERREKFHWAITLRGGDDQLRGRIDLWPYSPEKRDMRGFWLDPALHGRGLMTEAAEVVTGFAFRELGWPFLYLNNAVENRASGRIKEKQGAELIAIEPCAYVSGPGERQVWRLTREAWLARSGGAA
jgi:RimJ/RimL family protein N-acetyltransferase